jgi:hypothetical protein
MLIFISDAILIDLRGGLFSINKKFSALGKTKASKNVAPDSQNRFR